MTNTFRILTDLTVKLQVEEDEARTCVREYAAELRRMAGDCDIDPDISLEAIACALITCPKCNDADRLNVLSWYSKVRYAVGTLDAKRYDGMSLTSAMVKMLD